LGASSTLAHATSYLLAPQAGYGPVEDIAGMNRALTVFVLVLTLIVAGNFREAIMPAIVILMRSR
jgi:hypothetical protein